MSEYIGNRIVPRHDGVWQAEKAYEPLTIVLEEGTGDSYISRRPVPAGTLLSQKEYWAVCSRFSEQVKLFRDGVDADVLEMHEHLDDTVEAVNQKTDDTVSAVNQKADRTIDAINRKADETLAAMTERTQAAETLTSENRTALEKRMKQIETRQDANVTASTNANVDYAAELVDSRVDDTNHTFGSTGENIRALGKIRSLQNVALTWPWREGKIVDVDGKVANVGTWGGFHMIPVTGSRIFITGYLSFMSGNEEYRNITCFDRNRKFIGGCYRSPSGSLYHDYFEVLLPEGTAYVTVVTTTVSKNQIAVYLPEDQRPASLLGNYATAWQWMNGAAEIKVSGAKVTASFLKPSYLCRRVNGTDYTQTKAFAEDSVEKEFLPEGWWAVYFEDVVLEKEPAPVEPAPVEPTPEPEPTQRAEPTEPPTDTGETTNPPTDTEEPTDPPTEPPAEPEEPPAPPREPAQGILHVEGNSSWQELFTRNRFVIAAFFNQQPVYTAPASDSLRINGIEYGNPGKAATSADGLRRYLSRTLFLEYGQITLDMKAKTIRTTEKILATSDTHTYTWIEVDEEPVPLLESSELELNHLMILGFDMNLQQFNLYDTKTFQALGVDGFYVASWYQEMLWYPHMNPGMSFVYNGNAYTAGELFASEKYNGYVEKRYQNYMESKLTGLDRQDTHTMYLAYGGIEIDETANTIRITKRTLGVPDNLMYEWLYETEEPVEISFHTASGEYGMPMRILGYDKSTGTVNLYDTAGFRDLGRNGYYIAALYHGLLYHAKMNPMVELTINGKKYLAGELSDTASAAFVEKRYKDYVAAALSVNPDGDTLGDIVTPSHWDCMEGRQFSMFYDCLSRHEGRENLYRITNSRSLTRNEYCLNYTPAAGDTSFTVGVVLLDEETMQEKEKKSVQVRVHHPLAAKTAKNICICGDSLVDCNQVATEVFRLLAEDGDCDVTQIGTRGPENGRHEGRGSWTFAKYLTGTDYAGKSNAFWDAEKNRLDFRKYCAKNGYSGIDYFLIALGTNDVTQGSSLYRTEAQVQKFIDQAKQFIDSLLDPEVGFPNCKVGIGLCGPGSDYSFLAGSSMAIFKKSINTLNLALIKNFDEGKYRPNVTCFAHGLRTDRRLAFPYTNKPVTDRCTETSRTLTNSIHPSVRGYQAWADGYYCQIRAWLTEDAGK